MGSNKTRKYFNQVFPNLNLSGELDIISRKAIVSEVLIFKESKKIEMTIELDDIIYDEFIRKLEDATMAYVGGDFKVAIKVKYTNEIDSLKKTMHLYWDNIIHKTKCISPICAGIMMSAKWEVQTNTLDITIDQAYKEVLESKNIIGMIDEALEFELGTNLKVDLILEEKIGQEQSEFDKEKEKIEQKLISGIQVQPKESTPKPQEEKRNTNYRSKTKKVVSEMTILGRQINGSVISMNDINEETGEGVVIGDVLSVDSREIKGGRYILSFDMTDYSNSITIKSFVNKKDFEEVVKDAVKKGATLKVKGTVQYDKFSQELVMMTRDIEKSNIKFIDRQDHMEEKRVELHAHTQMSEMDATPSPSALVEMAAKWGHPAIAITDHGCLQAFPDAAKAAKKTGIKVLYGVEAYIVDDLQNVVVRPNKQNITDAFVVFDIETTGFNKEHDKIIEIGATKIVNGQIVDQFSEFINPERDIPDKITELTGISDEHVKDADTIDIVLNKFKKFVGNDVLVAHNASFDVGFIQNKGSKLGIEFQNTVLDTLELSRALFTKLKRFKLNVIAKHLDISLENHHRAVDDAAATAQILLKAFERLEELGVTDLEAINQYASERVDTNKLRANHAVILVQNYTGLRNLYELVSMSHIKYFYRKPRIPKSVYNQYKEGLIIGTACEAGELYGAVLNNDAEERIEELVNFYDYLEIQPLGNNYFMLDKGLVPSIDALKDINKRIVELGEKYNKLVVATCDVHFMNPKDEIFRKILMAAKKFKDADQQPPLYFRTTEEMLKEFDYLGEEKAFEVVVTNTNKVSEMLENIKPIPDETFPPKIEGADDELRSITNEKAAKMYGTPLPTPVQERLDRELNSIIKNGFAVLYIIAQKLVWKSLEDGYLVGSRGSVGSSFVATMATITEVNPLPPHYYCKECQYSDFDSDVVKSFAGRSGYDMPDKICPKCGETLIKEGHDIPFETFLGFDGDKEPDIDLNFSGEYQSRAHAYTEELFGEGQVFKAGTIGTLAEKTAYGFVKKYLDERNIMANNAEINRLIQGCTGVKRTTGQHPGGQMVVPQGYEIYKFCPVQRPANDVNSTITTTHFDYHSISGRLLKLDLLGHDDPTVIKMLEDLTGLNAQTIPLDDEETMSLFTSTNALGIEPKDIGSEVGSFGLPEFGTKFVRQMLVDTQPKTFSDLIRISGLSHGTDVWLNNAQELVREGTATLAECISTRDDIMVYLIIQGVEKGNAFTIMEKVRKGKGLTEDDEKEMKANGVPEWYIGSCKRIKYMFPKAHAAAYVMMAFRIAYYKVHYPECFYATFFTVRADDFDYELMCQGKDKVKMLIKEYEGKGNAISTKEKNVLTILEIVLEMYCREITFIPIDLYQSHSTRFQVTEEGIRPPLNAIQGLGSTAADKIVEARKDGEFISIEQFRQRTKVSKTVIEVMKELKIIVGLPETNQLSLF